MSNNDIFPILITGSSGQLATLIFKELIERGAPPSQIIAVTRTPEKLAQLASRGVVVRYGDFDKPETLPKAFEGAKRAMIISSSPEAYLEGKRLTQQRAAVAAAINSDVEHIYYTSAPHPEESKPGDAHYDHYQTELAIQASGKKWTILRHFEWPDWHLENNWLPALAKGYYYTGAGSGRIAHMTREDAAAADAGALLAPASEVVNRRFDLTGPEGLTADDIMKTMSEVSGKPIKVIHVSPEELGERLVAEGTDPVTANIFVIVAKLIRKGGYDGVTDHAEKFSGRRRTNMREFLAGKL